MAKEIERKFIIDNNKLPSDIYKYVLSSSFILQSYLSITNNEEVRVRQATSPSNKNTVCTLTIKRGNGLEREEIENIIEEETFDKLTGTTNLLRKTRWTVSMNGVRMEFDVYTSRKNIGLTIAEVEFDTSQEAEEFNPPEWFGQEVTEDKDYKNQSLWKKENGL